MELCLMHSSETWKRKEREEEGSKESNRSEWCCDISLREKRERKKGQLTEMGESSRIIRIPRTPRYA